MTSDPLLDRDIMLAGKQLLRSTLSGLIRRSADPEDRRSANVAATAAGRRMRERIHRERTQALGAHVEELDERQRQTLWEALPVLEDLAERLAGRAGRRP